MILANSGFSNMSHVDLPELTISIGLLSPCQMEQTQTGPGKSLGRCSLPHIPAIRGKHRPPFQGRSPQQCKFSNAIANRVTIQEGEAQDTGMKENNRVSSLNQPSTRERTTWEKLHLKEQKPRRRQRDMCSVGDGCVTPLFKKELRVAQNIGRL